MEASVLYEESGRRDHISQSISVMSIATASGDVFGDRIRFGYDGNATPSTEADAGLFYSGSDGLDSITQSWDGTNYWWTGDEERIGFTLDGDSANIYQNGVATATDSAVSVDFAALQGEANIITVGGDNTTVGAEKLSGSLDGGVLSDVAIYDKKFRPR